VSACSTTRASPSASRLLINHSLLPLSLSPAKERERRYGRKPAFRRVLRSNNEVAIEIIGISTPCYLLFFAGAGTTGWAPGTLLPLLDGAVCEENIDRPSKMLPVTRRVEA
jgi:hypothetical protein